MGGRARVQAVARAAQARRVPIRVGVNGGSLERELLAKYGAATAEALVESALAHVALLEAEGMRDIAVSVKASDVARTLAAYRLLAERTDCPLHLGVTEAGTFLPGTVRSSVALGILLEEGLGDTIRVSLTDAPEREVKVGLEILRALGLRAPGPSVTSCPTCGRTKVDVVGVAAAVEEALERLVRTDAARGRKLPRVAVMGCVVNGPGEAKGADVALCGGAREFLLYVGGRPAGKVRPEDAVAAVLSAVRGLMSEEAKG
ncbi:MAG: flavodoxin-dependent (E)-4-hydroxy-3-methylbut-2-enyl-diphosphate synthase [bacterium]|nr:flavodoxin-dependent (E)-4-hydroxy-3-methylbut-2-enyl-diphosphate synthase [bacterium]